jgi:hypothetical protein
MTGLKSGTGDDLWGDDADEEDESQSGPAEEESTEKSGIEQTTDTDSGSTTNGDASNEGSEYPYIVRRAMQDKGIQFERDERLTIFVHDDVADAEREVLAEVAQHIGRDVPKLDFREAAYRAALKRPEAVLRELGRMGYDVGSADK